ncbi:MAG: SEC-C domain-containing protein [Xanthomonadaceae bacterium]|nr:SEC-C domain-containing protein [Xanthomonadaceae bacterium]MDE1957814.1 SEC-C domain-containing protein [Xanthomonadaceae bacterium]MDE2176694.1 SEC-C domain-containing protein [Xanthomonadaceae bacterium]MDE2245422.1 SEC-C domain-containing protein [Xanthomonadaceae bacterium]
MPRPAGVTVPGGWHRPGRPWPGARRREMPPGISRKPPARPCGSGKKYKQCHGRLA